MWSVDGKESVSHCLIRDYIDKVTVQMFKSKNAYMLKAELRTVRGDIKQLCVKVVPE